MRTRTAFLFVALAASGCSTIAATSGHSPVTVPVTCTANQSAADCLRLASELCGEKGYDLFDREGNPIAVADILNRPATARCKG